MGKIDFGKPETKWEKFKDKLDWITVPFYRIQNKWGNIRCWFRNCFNKHHMKLVKEAWCSYPFDFSYMYYVERAQLYDMLEYFKNGHIIVQESYDEMIKRIKVMISLLDIILDDNEGRSLFGYDGDMKFIPCEDSSCYRLDDSNLIYHCDVKVNLRNMDRFITGPQKQSEIYMKFAQEHPHEIYQQKAKYLYHKMRYYFMETFWD